jgi:excinuclease UvrABC nuclease subunit
VRALPAEPGVYRFRDDAGRVLYVGRAMDLRRRVGSYWGDLRDRRHLRRMIPRVARIEALVCASAHEAAWAERNLLERSMPPWNRIPGGLEVPVCIRLETSASAPRLDVVHAPRATPGTRHFGPYLGSRKVRAAVSALHRVHPLAYVGSGLSAAQRDLGRLREAGRGDVRELAGAITAVLEREPAAVAGVRASLTARRDAAAEAQAYESAARLHEELAALDWVVAPQRVTAAAARDEDLSGWAGGVLVRFRIRGGRLCGWEQRHCRESGAGTTGSGPWSPFLQRNAELAAVLCRHPVG